MRVFISWSGPRSLAAARALSEFLPLVLQPVTVWTSADDIRAGTRWSTEIMSAVESSTAGLVCVTRDNLTSPWLLFEAGALSKAGVPIFIFNVDVSPVDVSGPLAQFQFITFTRDEILKFIEYLNSHLDRPVKPAVVEKLFGTWWPRLLHQLSELPSSARLESHATIIYPPAVMSDRDVINEILETVRKIAEKLDRR